MFFSLFHFHSLKQNLTPEKYETNYPKSELYFTPLYFQGNREYCCTRCERIHARVEGRGVQRRDPGGRHRRRHHHPGRRRPRLFANLRAHLQLPHQHTRPALHHQREGGAEEHGAAVRPGVQEPRVQCGGHGLWGQGFESDTRDHCCITSLCYIMDRYWGLTIYNAKNVRSTQQKRDGGWIRGVSEALPIKSLKSYIFYISCTKG